MGAIAHPKRDLIPARTYGGEHEQYRPLLDPLQTRPAEPAYWRVTFDHPPINTITATTMRELSSI